MAQAFYCRTCNVSYGAELRGKSCPACGDELVHGRIPASRTHRKASASAGVGRAVWDHILKRDPCSYCGVKFTPKTTTIDHIVPKALGGSKGSWTNRTASCQPCNGRKAHTPLLFFLLEEQGVDLDWMKNEDGDWPIPPPEDIEAEIALEERSSLSPMDPRRMLTKSLAQDG